MNNKEKLKSKLYYLSTVDQAIIKNIYKGVWEENL